MAEIIPTLPKDFKIAIVRDQSEFIENSLHAIEEHLVLGAIFAAVVVFLFLWNFRSTIISGARDPNIDHCGFCIDRRSWVFAKPDDNARLNPYGRHRYRRRHSSA